MEGIYISLMWQWCHVDETTNIENPFFTTELLYAYTTTRRMILNMAVVATITWPISLKIRCLEKCTLLIHTRTRETLLLTYLQTTFTSRFLHVHVPIKSWNLVKHSERWSCAESYAAKKNLISRVEYYLTYIQYIFTSQAVYELNEKKPASGVFRIRCSPFLNR